MSESSHWFDDQAGPVVRPYALTRGRARPVTGRFDLIAYVAAAPGAGPLAADLQPEHHAILGALARGPVTVAELASRLDLGTGVVRVLLGDLLAEGQISIHEPATVTHLPDDNVLKAVIDGLRSL